MIAFLRGSVLDKSPESAVIEASGVGYQVSLTAGAARELPDLGREARLWIYTHATQEGGAQLFGFTQKDERGLFETLLGVQGVGPKVAVAVLSGMPVADLIRAIGAGDVARLTSIKGVGRKTAERLAVELRDKLGPAAGKSAQSGTAPAMPPGKIGDVYGALLSLGYRSGEFESVVAKLDPGKPTAELVRESLSALRRK